MSNARAFFETHLRWVCSWDMVVHRQPESLPPLPNGRRNPMGKFKEQISLSFAGFDLVLSSPEDDPPLGWVECRHLATDDICEGPPDPVIWDNIASFIKERSNGEGRRAAAG